MLLTFLSTESNDYLAQDADAELDLENVEITNWIHAVQCLQAMWSYL